MIFSFTIVSALILFGAYRLLVTVPTDDEMSKEKHLQDRADALNDARMRAEFDDYASLFNQKTSENE